MDSITLPCIHSNSSDQDTEKLKQLFAVDSASLRYDSHCYHCEELKKRDSPKTEPTMTKSEREREIERLKGLYAKRPKVLARMIKRLGDGKKRLDVRDFI